MSGQHSRLPQRYETFVERANAAQHRAARHQTAERTAEAQILLDPRRVLPVADGIQPSSPSLQDETDNLPAELDDQADVASMNRPPSSPSPQPSLGLRHELSLTSSSSSNQNSDENDGSRESSSETIRSLEARLEQERRLRSLVQRDLKQRKQKIAELERKAQIAHDRQVEAIENDSSAQAASWERKYGMLREVLRRTEEEKSQLTKEIREHEVREDKLRRQLRRAWEGLDEQQERDRVMGSRLGEAENNIARLGNVVAQLNDHQDRGIERARNITTLSDSQTAEQQLEGHHRRERRVCGTGDYGLVTTRDPQGNVSLRHAITRPITRRQAYLFGG